MPAIIDRGGREAERARSILRDTERAKRKIKRAYRIDCPQCDGTGKIHMDDQKRILRQIDEKLNVDQVNSPSTHDRLLTAFLIGLLKRSHTDGWLCGAGADQGVQGHGDRP